MAAEDAPRQWRASEFAFTAEKDCPAPMSLELLATFTGPGGEKYAVPGFWDGGRTWRVRFAPTAPGRWSYVTACREAAGSFERTLFESGLLRGGEAAKRVSVPVAGVEELTLLVSDGGDNTNWDHADWADARLVAAGGAETRLGALQPREAAQGHGTLAVDRNLTGRPLAIGERTFERGLGTHAASRIVYRLDGRFERFEAWVGLDALTGKNGSVRFQVVGRGERKPTNASFEGLAGQRGEFTAGPASGENALYRHGGFLRVSENRRHLVYSDGTPFFWLGDTWWFCPSETVPLEGSSSPRHRSMYRTLIDTRARQGYTVAQMCFLGFMKGAGQIDAPLAWDEKAIARWREADRYVAYANEAGIVPVIGLAFHKGMDRAGLESWKRTWRYAVARLGAYPVTWLICGEYNLNNPKDRVAKVLALGEYIKSVDPYKRAMTVHAWYHRGERRQAWARPWYDFIMIQGGHDRNGPPPETYLDAWRRREPKPVLEAECCYEGIHGMGAEVVRRVAYRAIQSGSFGYTYGAHGLWYPTQNAEDRTFSNWGKPVVWWEALARPGGAQMRHLRACYESVAWWRLEPRPDAVSPEGGRRIHAKADGDRVFLVYFEGGIGPKLKATLKGGNAALAYAARWFNPRDGRTTKIPDAVRMPGGAWALPERPDGGDWVLIVEARP